VRKYKFHILSDLFEKVETTSAGENFEIL